MSVDDDPTTKKPQTDVEVTLTTPRTDSSTSVEVDQFEQIIAEALPLPVVVGGETYSTPTLVAEQIKDFDTKAVNDALIKEGIFVSKDIVVVTNPYLAHRNVKFNGKSIYVVNDDGTYAILKPDLSHIKSSEEEARLFQYEKGPDGETRKKIYRYSDGTPILHNNQKIPIYRSKGLEYRMKLKGQKGELDEMRKRFQVYLDNPERISHDGHSATKHSFDCITSLKLIIEEQSNGLYYKIERILRKDEYDKQKPIQYRFILSTNEVVTLPGEYQPEKLVHTEIAREVANALKERIDPSNSKESNRVDQNVRSWIKEFAQGEPILAIALYNEIKYLLKYDSNLDYDTPKRYTINEIDKILPDEGIREILEDNKVYRDEINEISNIFRFENVVNGKSHLEELLSFESKVDTMLEYLKSKGIHENTMDYLRLSAGFDRVVKPKVILKGVANQNTTFPTTSIITSYIQEYLSNQFIGDFCKHAVSKKMYDKISESAVKARKLLDRGMLYVSSNISGMSNIHLLEGRWVDALSKQIPRTLNMSSSDIEKFAKHAKG